MSRVLPADRSGALKRSVPRRAEKKQVGGEQRRLVQLMVSLALFLLVFFGRGVFPGQMIRLSEIVRTDTDFIAVFRELQQVFIREGTLKQTMEAFIFGRQEPPVYEAEPSGVPEVPDSMLSGARLGLEQTAQYGIRPDYSKKSATESAPLDPAPEPTAQVVTAVAQVYAEDGSKLPSNVSFLRYELGLEKTVIPVFGDVTSGFGYRISPVTGKREFHLALDIAADEGTEIQAFADGVVEYIGESKEFGLYLKLNHANGVSTFYAHCSRLLVRKGEKVTCGQTVALVGSTGTATGPHLHLTILKDDVRLDPAHYVDL